METRICKNWLFLTFANWLWSFVSFVAVHIRQTFLSDPKIFICLIRYEFHDFFQYIRHFYVNIKTMPGGGEGVQLWNFLILYCVNDKSSAAELDPLGGGGGCHPKSQLKRPPK